MSQQPTYGTERIVLLSPRPNVNEKHEIHRLIFVQQGSTTFFNDEAGDFVTWNGSWQLVEILGQFDTPDQAREFMIAREAAA